MWLDRAKVLRTADRHLVRGKVTAAIEEMLKLVHWDPTDLTTLNALGDLYVRAGSSDKARLTFLTVASGYQHQDFASKAIGVLKKVLRIDPTDLEAAAKLAECYASRGRKGEAVLQYMVVAEAYERTGRESKALEAYQKAADLDRSNPALLMTLGDRWLSERFYERAHTSFVAAGDEFSNQGKNSNALAAYLKAYAIQPDDRKVLAAIASICTTQGQAESALPILCESIEKNSSDAELHRILGSTYLATGQLEDARRTFLSLAALDDGEYRCLLSIGEKLLEMGDLDRAVEEVDSILEIMMARQEEQQAIDFLQKVLERDSQHPGSLKRLALIFRRNREDYNLIRTLKVLTQSAIRRGDREEAAEALKELCALEPRNSGHRDDLQDLGIEPPVLTYAAIPKAVLPSKGETLGKTIKKAGVLCHLGRAEEAADLLRQLSKDDPENLEVHLALKEVYSIGGLTDLASNECLHIGRIRLANRPTSEFGESLLTDRPQDSLRLARAKLISVGANGPLADFEFVTEADRRQAERISMRLPLVVFSGLGGWREYTETVDVSELGMALRLAHPVAPLTMLSLSLESSKWPQRFSRMMTENAARVVVRYSRITSAGANLVGVELWSLPDQIRQEAMEQALIA